MKYQPSKSRAFCVHVRNCIDLDTIECNHKLKALKLRS